MRMHLGRKAAAIGLAAAVVGGVAGTALAASGATAATPAAAKIAAVKAAATTQQPQLVKMSMTALTAKLGATEPEMIKALDDMKDTVVTAGKLSPSGAHTLMVKVLATDLDISGAAATWAVDEITGGYVPTSVNWGFPK